MLEFILEPPVIQELLVYTIIDSAGNKRGTIDNRYGVWHLGLEDLDAECIYNTVDILEQIVKFMNR